MLYRTEWALSPALSIIHLFFRRSLLASVYVDYAFTKLIFLSPVWCIRVDASISFRCSLNGSLPPRSVASLLRFPAINAKQRSEPTNSVRTPAIEGKRIIRIFSFSVLQSSSHLTEISGSVTSHYIPLPQDIRPQQFAQSRRALLGRIFVVVGENFMSFRFRENHLETTSSTASLSSHAYRR